MCDAAAAAGRLRDQRTVFLALSVMIHHARSRSGKAHIPSSSSDTLSPGPPQELPRDVRVRRHSAAHQHILKPDRHARINWVDQRTRHALNPKLFERCVARQRRFDRRHRVDHDLCDQPPTISIELLAAECALRLAVRDVRERCERS